MDTETHFRFASHNPRRNSEEPRESGHARQAPDGSASQERRKSRRTATSVDEQLPNNMEVDMTHLEEIARHCIVRQLRENGFEELADQFQPVRDPDHNAYRMIDTICTQLERERAEQFDEIIASLTVTDTNLEETYRQLITHVFHEGVNWGKIITFLVFSARMALHCARYGMEEKVTDIVKWTQDEMRDRIHGWVRERGGWAAFVSHYDDESWKMSLSSFLVVTSMVAVMLASGVFMAKRFLF